MRPEDIEIGTSGWKFDDWAGPFYPLRVPHTKWLEYYAARFPIGEINSTYYRIAPQSVYAAIDKKTPANFRLFAKVHADVTHERKDARVSLEALRSALTPLRDAGKLLGLLAQFPTSFQFGALNADYLSRIREYAGNDAVCVEFRHRSWLDDRAIELVRDNEMTWVCPDEPPLPDLLPRKIISTSDILYVRMHGRNARAWYDHKAGDRYDYNYSESELSELGNELLTANASAKKAYVLFNNCYAGQAPQNAWWLKLWLDGMRAADSGETNSDEFDLLAN
jgi:uncharacterized protein YecE (DUF72 family)